MQLSDAIKRVSPRVVQIQAGDAAGATPSIVLGTGFFVDGLHVITANHVIVAHSQIAETHPVLRIGVGLSDFNGPVLKTSVGFVGIPARSVAIDTANDLALLEVEHFPGGDRIEVEIKLDLTDDNGASTQHVAKFASGGAELDPTPVKDGQSIATSGFPLSIPSLVSTAGIVASKLVMDDSNPELLTERFLADLTVNGGNSGGPAYDAGTGAIVGVVIAHRLAPSQGAVGILHNAGLTIVVPIKPILNLLSENAVSPVLRPPARARRR